MMRFLAMMTAALLAAGPSEAAVYTFEYVSAPLHKGSWDFWPYSHPDPDPTDEDIAAIEKAYAALPEVWGSITYRFVLDEAKQPGGGFAGNKLRFSCKYSTGCTTSDGWVFDEISADPSFGFVAWDRGYIVFDDAKNVTEFLRDGDSDPGWVSSFQDAVDSVDGRSEEWLLPTGDAGILNLYTNVRGTWTVTVTDTPAPVPLPAGAGLLATAVVALSAAGWSRRNAKRSPAI